MARLTECDNCGKKRENLDGWLSLTRPYEPPAPSGYVILPGVESLDFCSPACAVAFLETRPI